MPPFYVTTPIYYVNARPHIGHIYTTIVADTVARYRRFVGDDVRLVTGTDEHGQKIERAAAEIGVTPAELADEVVEDYRSTWRRLGISHDDFIRTTEARHRTGVEALIRRIQEAGDLYVDRHEGWYCVSCESFYTEKELLPESLCPVHESEAEWHAEDNVFFRLSRYQKPLLEWYESSPTPVRPDTRANEVRAFVESGLRDLSVSRAGLDWGIPFPGHPGQTVYVWMDALVNYVSALGFGGEEAALYQRYWRAPEGTRLHLVGKDILRFHAVYWPAFLLSAGLPLPDTVWAHGWWLRDAKKVSKTGGNIVRTGHLVEEFGGDALRHVLLRDMVFGQDASFSDEGFVERFNSDLANDLGNSVSRLVTLCRQAFDGRTPPEACDDNPLMAVAGEQVREYRRAMEELAFHQALASLWKLLAETNQYFVAREPWKLLKEEGATSRLSRILWNSLEALRIVSTALLPVLPETAPRLLASVGADASSRELQDLAWGGLPTGAPLPEPQPIFPRIDKDAYLAGLQESPAPEEEAPEEDSHMISIEEFGAVQLRIGTVTAAAPVPRADKLLQLTVSLGEEGSRTLVAGIAQVYEPDELEGRQVVVVTNLRPATIMSVESQGMVLAASDEGTPVLLAPDSKVPDGTRVR